MGRKFIAFDIETAKEIPGDKVFGNSVAMDMTWCVNGTASGGKCVSVKTDCESSKMWSTLLKRKDDVPQADLNFMGEIVGEGKVPPSFLRMDRANENKEMAVSIEKKCLKIKMV